MAIPGDTRACDKEREKIEKYILLKDEIARLPQMKKVVGIPIALHVLIMSRTRFRVNPHPIVA